MIRQVALDTETTGLSVEMGHRLIEIGCVEIINRRLTGKIFHCYLNPERSIEHDASVVHGLRSDFLSDKPKFSEKADEFIAFIKASELIIHNAAFDVGFINYEFERIKKDKIEKFSSILDTLALARQRHPGQRNSLEALCKRYHVNDAHRHVHGALIDAELLAQVYLAMTSGQNSLFKALDSTSTAKEIKVKTTELENMDLPVIQATEVELQLHREYLESIQVQSMGKCLWLNP